MVERVIDLRGETRLSLSILHESELDPIEAGLEHLLVRAVRRDQSLEIDVRLSGTGTEDRKGGKRRDFFAATGTTACGRYVE